MGPVVNKAEFSARMITAVLVIGIVFTSAIYAASGGMLSTESQEQTGGNKTTNVKEELAAQEPDLADIIPSAAELTGRLATLENKIRSEPNVAEIEKKFSEIEVNLNTLAGILQKIKDTKDYRYSKLADLREAIKREDMPLDKVSKPVSQAVHELEALRKEWLTKKRNWSQWQSYLLKEEGLEQLKSTFEKANETIGTAINHILVQLQAMLTVQAKAGDIEIKIEALTAEIDELIANLRCSVFFDRSVPMFSSRYVSQFSGGLWLSVQRGVGEILRPYHRVFAQQGWVVITQGILSLIAIIAVYRNRGILSESKRWRFLAVRPISAGLFFVNMIAFLIFEYKGAPVLWKVATLIVIGVCFARLFGVLIEARWKRQFVYGLIIVFLVNNLIYLLRFPIPIVRLYTVLTALAGLIFCLRWTRKSGHDQDLGFYKWLLRSGSLFFVMIMIAELLGEKLPTSFLLVSLIDSVVAILVSILFIYIIRGVFEWLFRTSPLKRTAVLRSDDTDVIIRRVSQFVEAVLLGLILLPAILFIWGVFDSVPKATKGLLVLGFNLGSKRISLGLIIISAGILYGSFLISWIFRKVLIDKELVERQMEKGVRLAIGRLVHYAFIFVGFLLAISTLGIEVTKLTIVLSALGVGIGFGLQGVVNNFVSGLILLFERPVRVGDIVVVNGIWSEVKRIGLRSTTLQSFDQSEVTIPNADLITNQVTNWTLSNRRRRLEIRVGVAYGSDVLLVMETLMACAKSNPKVDKTPEPQVLFLSFGESSLNFELWVFVSDVGNSLNVISELHQEIDRCFRKAKIEIAFPQRDLHLRSVDESVILGTSETNKYIRRTKSTGK